MNLFLLKKCSFLYFSEKLHGFRRVLKNSMEDIGCDWLKHATGSTVFRFCLECWKIFGKTEISTR